MPTKELSYINYNGDTYTIIDSTADNKYAELSHSHMMDDITDGVQGVYYVNGTQTASTGSWTGNLTTVDALYEGLTIAYRLPYAGDGNASLTLTLKNNTQTAAIPVYYTGTSRATTHFAAQSVIILTYANGGWRHANYVDGNTVPATSVATAAATAAKVGTHTYYTAKANSYTLVTIRYANTAKSALTLNINSQGAKPIYINGTASSASNYTLPAGTYLVYYDGTNYYFNTTGDIPNIKESLSIPNGWTWDKSKVELSNVTSSGNKIADVSIDGTETTLYSPTYTGTSPISITASTRVISHTNSGATAGTYGVTATTELTPTFGDKISIPGFTINETGHTTAAGAHNVQLPNLSFTRNLTSGTKVGTLNINGTETDLYAPTNTNTTYTFSKNGNILTLTPSSGTAQTVTLNVASTTADGLLEKDDKIKLNGISTNANKTEVTQSLTSGTVVGKIYIDGTETTLYAPTNTNTWNAYVGATVSTDGTAGYIPGATKTQLTHYFAGNGTWRSAPTAAGEYGLISYEEKNKLAGISESADSVSYTRILTSGVSIGKITINGTETEIFTPTLPTAESLGLNKALKLIGFATVEITDGSTTDPGITGYTTKTAGDVVIDSATHYEYVWTTQNKWERLGGDGDYALSGVEYDVTNGGTNAKSAVTISPTTTAVYSMTSAGSVVNGVEASLSMAVNNEKLTFSFETNTPTVVTLPGRSSAINAWTGYNTGVNNTYAAAQTFTPTNKTITIN